MNLLVLTLCALGTCMYVVYPLIAAHRARVMRDRSEKVNLLKVFAIRRYYPQLRHLTVEEIRARYQVEASYQAIGHDLL
jgi:hypothetical protein